MTFHDGWMDGYYQGGPTRPILESVHFKIIKGNLVKKGKTEARKSAEDTELLGIV